MIRTVTKDDAAKIVEIYNYYILNTIITFEKEPVRTDDINSRISDIVGSSLPWLVLEIDGEVIGYTYASKWRARPAYKHTVETTVYLSKNHSGKGFGKLLYTKLLTELTASGFHTAIGGIALPNESSVRLHESLGFKKTAHFYEVGNKFDQWIDVGFWQILL
ncbi:MAG: phosphinothricin acetyltransferase [Anaerolineaceae bacterium]|nr:phosphinothricin acetyltransferase [Anaerolineaceae bacterium]